MAEKNIALVSPDGRYHGHYPDVDAIRATKQYQEKGKTELRALSSVEWDQVASLSDADREAGKRAELCASLGSVV